MALGAIQNENPLRRVWAQPEMKNHTSNKKDLESGNDIANQTALNAVWLNHDVSLFVGHVVVKGT